jgi:hypothetical protein
VPPRYRFGLVTFLVPKRLFVCQLLRFSGAFCTRNYINHFISADTVIPSYTNPQDLNRYSYVNNNPLRYTDPTGHMRVEEPGSKKGCSDPKYCKGIDSNGKVKPKINKGKGANNAANPCTDPGKCGGTVYSHGLDDPLKILDEENYMFGGYGRLKSWDGIKQIDPKDWNSLLARIGNDISASKIKTGWYDTPFYNYGGLLKGTACINGKCYDRAELNYIGEGEALAARGKSKEKTLEFVNNWKEIVYGHPASYGVNDMTGVGWDYYHEHYP